jgi:hypothetical protein
MTGWAVRKLARAYPQPYEMNLEYLRKFGGSLKKPSCKARTPRNAQVCQAGAQRRRARTTTNTSCRHGSRPGAGTWNRCAWVRPASAGRSASQPTLRRAGMAANAGKKRKLVLGPALEPAQAQSRHTITQVNIMPVFTPLSHHTLRIMQRPGRTVLVDRHLVR